MYSKFIMPVRADICREISKRRVYSHRKDEKTGQIKKRKNPGGTSSPFGWGAVTDTFMLNTKILDSVRRNLNMYILQISKKTYLEQATTTTTTKKRPRVLPPLPQDDTATKKIRIAPNIKDWYNQCKHFIESGSIGLVPDCWSDGESLPPLEDLMHTQIGQVLLNYNTFLRGRL